MKVRAFQSILGINRESDGNKDIAAELESKINKFLEDNPNIRVKDIKLAAHAAEVSNIATNYALFALVLYDD